MGRKKYQGQFRGGNGTHEKVSLTPFFRLRPALISHVVGVAPTPIFPQKKRRRTAPPTMNLYQPPGLAARLAASPKIAGLPIGQEA
jgi:hypothetical protein